MLKVGKMEEFCPLFFYKQPHFFILKVNTEDRGLGGFCVVCGSCGEVRMCSINKDNSICAISEM